MSHEKERTKEHGQDAREESPSKENAYEANER